MFGLLHSVAPVCATSAASPEIKHPLPPLDGSDRGRIKWTTVLLLHRIRCREEAAAPDLLTLLKTDPSYLGHERFMGRRGMQHWFMQDASVYGIPWSFEGTTTAAEQMRITLEQLVLGPRDLEQLEVEWMSTHTKEKRLRIENDSSAYWIARDSGMWETGSFPRVFAGFNDKGAKAKRIMCRQPDAPIIENKEAS